MKLIEVEATPELVAPNRARLSYPILKEFLAGGMGAAKVDLEDLDRPKENVYVTLCLYVKASELPVKVSMRKGDLFLGRTDIVDGKAEALDLDVLKTKAKN